MAHTTAIQILIDALVQVNGLNGLIAYAGSVNPEMLLKTLTGKTAKALLAELEASGVSSKIISEFKNVLSHSNATSLLYTLIAKYDGGLCFNINPGNGLLLEVMRSQI